MNLHIKSIKEIKEWDMVQFLSTLGYEPHKIRDQDYWYLSPLREERTPSFKVNRRLNVWYDHGIGQGGNLVDFGILYFNCSVSNLLHKLSQQSPSPTLSFHPQKGAGEKKNARDGRILVISSRPLTNNALLNYLEQRCIPIEVAVKFCSEVDFQLYDRRYTAIGFQNKSGGYELRNDQFKGSCSPKDFSFIDNGKGQVLLFEGFFNFLSYFALQGSRNKPVSNFLVLNSLALLPKARDVLDAHSIVHLFLDNDNSGKAAKEQLLRNSKYKDASRFYHGYKDVNDWWISKTLSVRQQITQTGKLRF